MALTPEEELAQLQAALAAEPPVVPEAPAPAPTAAAAPAPAAAAPAPAAAAPAPVPPPQGVPTYAPPPPPPPTPAAAALPGQIADYATNWMQTPNRYLSELATATRTAGEARLKQGETEGLRSIEEWAASRGLVGSNLEGELGVNLQEKQGITRAEQERALLEMLATAETQDRAAAGTYGISAAELGDTVGLERYRALMDAYGIEAGVGLDQQSIDLRAQELQQNAALQGRSLSIDEARLQADKEQFSAKLGQDATQFDQQIAEQQADRMQNLGLSTRELDIEADRLIQDAKTQDKTLTLQEARDQAEIGFRAKELQQGDKSLTLQEARDKAEIEFRGAQLTQERDLAEMALTQRATEFAQQMNLSEREFTQSQVQFSQQMAEQVAGRMQQASQFAASLADSQAGRAMSFGLQTRALDLQEKGQDADTAYKNASLEMEDRLGTEANRLTALGISNDDAYRYAALSEDASFHKLTIDLQNKGLDQNAALAGAEQIWRASEAEKQREFDKEMSNLDFERLMEYLKALGLTPAQAGAAAVTGGGGIPGSNNSGDNNDKFYD